MPLYPQKNLLKGFKDFINNIMDISDVQEWSMTVGSKLGNGYWLVDVKPNTVYTFSIGKDDVGIKLAPFNKDASVNISPYTTDNYVTFNTGNNYQVRLYISRASGSASTVKNVMFNEGGYQPFEPYELGMKSAKRIEKINEDMTGASSHVYPYGNIISVKEDVRLWGYQIQAGTPAGTYDSVIYEWNNGSIGEPLFREVIDCTANTLYNLSFKGTRLQAGKKYYIGRNDPQRNNSSNGTAGVWRKTGMPGADFKYITTLGGSQFYSPAIDFPSTWYYIFGLEVEATNLKKSVGFPSINLLNPDPSKWRQGSADSSGNLTGGSTRLVLAERIKMSPNTKYTIKLENGYRMFMRNFSDQVAEISNSGWVTDGYTFTTSPNIRTTLVLIARGDDTALNIDEVSKALPMLAQGDWAKNIRYEEVMKSSSLVPKKNLLKDIEKIDASDLWIKENGVNYCYKTGEKFQGADVYRISFDPLNNGRVFQYFDTKGIHSASIWVKYIQYDTTLVLTLREQNFGIAAGLTSINQNIPDWQQVKLENANVATDKPYMFALYKSGKTQTKDVIVDIAMPQLEKNSAVTNYSVYELGMKPAILYPKKNFIFPFDQWNADAGITLNFVEFSQTRIVMDITSASPYKGLRMPINWDIMKQLLGKTVTLSAKALTNSSTYQSQVQLRFFGGAANTDFVLNANKSTTKLIPADHTSAFMVAQINVAGTIRIEVDRLQLEIGNETDYAPYELTTMKPN